MKMPKPKIMMIDDEEIILELYGDELKEEGYDFVGYQSPDKWKDKIEKERPDVVLLDVKLREHDGLEVLQDIREKFYNLPIILCSAYSSFKGDLKSIYADHYVVKNADLTELKKKLNLCLESRVKFQNQTSS